MGQQAGSAGPWPDAPQGGRLGGICAILIGGLNVLLVIYVVATPASQRYGAEAFFTYYAQNPLPLSLAWVMLSLTSVLAFAVVPAVGDYLPSAYREWIRPASILGIVAFAVTAVSFVTLIGAAPGLAQGYVHGDNVSKAAIAAVGLPELDPNGWIMFGGSGIWILVVNLVGWRSGRLPRLQAAIGLLCALCYWATVFADVLTLEMLNLIAAGGGAIFAPIWYVWMGTRLMRASSGRLPDASALPNEGRTV